MARFYSLIALLFFTLLSGASATVAPVTKYRVIAPQYNFDSGYVSSAVGACNSLATVIGTAAGVGTIGDVVGTYCQVWPLNRFSMYGSWSIGQTFACPDGSSGSGGTCTCNEGFSEVDGACKKPTSCPSGQHEEGGACVPDNCKPNEVRVNGLCVAEPPCPEGQERVNGVCVPKKCEAGKSAGDKSGFDSDATTYACETATQCLYKITPSICVHWDGKTSCSGTGYYTGGSCSGGSGGPNPSGPTTGGDTGGSNTGGDNTGGTTSGGNDGGGTTGGGTTGGGTTGGGTTGGGTTGGDTTGGGTTGGGTTGGGTSGSGVGLPKPVTTPPNPDGTCPSGQQLTTDKKACIGSPKPPDGDGKCPAGMVKIDTMCHSTEPSGANGDGSGDGSYFAGQCEAGFACEGDAIQCAIAKEQHRRNCQLMENKSAESQLYDQEKGKEGKRTENLPGNESHDLNGRISSADLLGGGSGMQDLTITVMGASVTLPLSRINSYLAALGNVLLAVSFLMAVRIVGRG